MSERMKPEDRLHGVTPVALRQHQPQGGGGSLAGNGVDRQSDGMAMQVKMPGNFGGGHRLFFLKTHRAIRSSGRAFSFGVSGPVPILMSIFAVKGHLR